MPFRVKEATLICTGSGEKSHCSKGRANGLVFRERPHSLPLSGPPLDRGPERLTSPGPRPSCGHVPPTQSAAVRGHLEELRSLLTQSSWEVVSPFPIMLHVLRFFLRCVVPSPSDPDSHWTRKEKSRNSTGCNPVCQPTSALQKRHKCPGSPRSEAAASAGSATRPATQPRKRRGCPQTPGGPPAFSDGGAYGFRIKTRL